MQRITYSNKILELDSTNSNPHLDGRINVQFEQDIQIGIVAAVRVIKVRSVHASDVRFAAVVRLRERLRVRR